MNTKKPRGGSKVKPSNKKKAAVKVLNKPTHTRGDAAQKFGGEGPLTCSASRDA